MLSQAAPMSHGAAPMISFQSHKAYLLQSPEYCPSKLLKLNGWGWSPEFCIPKDWPQMADAGQCFEIWFSSCWIQLYVGSSHWKAEFLASLYSQSLPLNNILSPTCKTPQAIRIDRRKKDITGGILHFTRGTAKLSFSKERLLQQKAKWGIRNAAMTTIMWHQNRCCPCAWLSSQSWLWLLWGLWSTFF